MKVEETPRLSVTDPTLIRYLREMAVAINSLAEGRLSGSYNALATTVDAPGVYANGDYIMNSAPARGMYRGWVYIAGEWFGVSQIGAIRGNTASRPNAAALGVATSAGFNGYLYLDTTLDADGKPIWRSGSNWVDATGAVV